MINKTKRTKQEIEFFMSLLEEVGDNQTKFPENYVLSNVRRQDRVALYSVYEILGRVGNKLGYIWNCPHCLSFRSFDEDCCDHNSDGDCSDCGGEGWYDCHVCRGCGEGQVGEARCYACKGKGETPCNLCRPEYMPDYTPY